jgi:5'-3' exonuclease
MGIPYYVASLLRAHKHANIEKKIHNEPVEVDILGIDFNCFIHRYLDDENPVGSIMVALDDLLTKTVRAKKVFLAFDGLVPYAKMVQQRYRRMARPGNNIVFDRQQISPGTPYMKELADTIQIMFQDIVVSDTLDPGEGEHKIFKWLQHTPKKDRAEICIYGLDADLVLIAIAQSHLGNIRVLREVDEENHFSTISIQALMSVLPLDPQRFVEMSVLCFGNDFMPTIAMFSLREDGYKRALYFAERNDAAKQEKKVLLKRAKDSDRHIIAQDGHALEARFGAQCMDGVVNWEPVVYAFWKTYRWTLHYFQTSDVLDWKWYYPYPEAPLMETIDAYDHVYNFTWENPVLDYTVEEQLQFILPEYSLQKTGLPSIYPDEFYDEETDKRYPWMKKFAWECEPYISLPFSGLTKIGEYALRRL